jgi:hypothetical protein
MVDTTVFPYDSGSHMSKPPPRKQKPASKVRPGLFHEEVPSKVSVWVLVLPVLLFAAIGAFHDLRCSDTGFHVKTGEWVLQHHSVPRSDPFSYTAFGQPWIAHEWLFGVIAYVVDRASGVTGLIVMKALLILLALGMTAWIAQLRRTGPGWTSLILAATFVIASPRFQERPEILSLPIAVAFLLVYEKSSNNNRLLVLLPVLQLLWINIHGGTALLGWALAGGFLAERAWRRCNTGSLPALRTIAWEAAAFAGVVIASFLNPNFLKALTYGLLRTQSPLEIDEFHSFREAVQAGFMIRATLFLVWTALLGLLFVIRSRSVRLYEWFLFPALLIVCLVYFRFSSLFAFLLAPTLSSQLSEWRLSSRLRWWIPAVVSAVLLTHVGWSQFQNGGFRFGTGLSQSVLAVRSSQFIKTSALQGNMFNTYDFGGYLIWSLWPEHQVFIDGREDVYVNPGILDEYIGRFASRENWDRLVSRHAIDFAVVGYPVEVPSSEEASLDRLAFDRSSWALVFMDDVAAVYVKRNGRNDEVIRQSEIKTIQPFQLSTYLDNILADPARNALFQSEVQAILNEIPESFRLHFLLGMYAVKRGPAFLEDAMREFEQAARINPEFVPAHVNLGGIYLNRGRTHDATREYRKALELDPSNTMAKQQLQALKD